MLTTGRGLPAASILGICLAVACSDSTDEGLRPDRATGPGKLDVVPEYDGGMTHVVFGTVNEFQIGGIGPTIEGGEPRSPIPVAGVEVCVLDTDNCVLTNSAGNYNLQLEPDPEGSLVFSKNGYYPVIAPASTGADDIGWLNMVLLPEALMETFAGVLMTPWPNDDQGIVVVIASHEVQNEETGVLVNVSRPGVQFELTKGEAGVQYYGSEMAIPLSTLTETTTIGWGGFVAVEPGDSGDTEITYTREPDDECSVTLGFPGSTPDSVTGPVRGGSSTYLQFICR